MCPVNSAEFLQENKTCIGFHGYRDRSCPRIQPPGTTLLNAPENKAPKTPTTQTFRKYLPSEFLRSHPRFDTKPTTYRIKPQNTMDPCAPYPHTKVAIESSTHRSAAKLTCGKKKPPSPSGSQPSSLLVPQRPCQPGDLVRHCMMLCRSQPQQCKGARKLLRRVCVRRSR